MSGETSWLDLPETRRAVAAGDNGALLRIARAAKGWTLAEAGRHCGYSAPTLSRFERGRQPLLDIALLRRLATVFEIPPEYFGLATRTETVPAPSAVDKVRGRPAHPDGEGAVRRRDLLGGVVGVAGFALPGTPSGNGLAPGVIPGPTAADQRPVSAAVLATELAAARQDFGACRYQQLAGRLPHLVAQATVNRDNAAVDAVAAASGQLADAYGLATQLLLKLHDDVLAWSMADRGLQAARAAADPIAVAEATRLTATVLRRTRHGDGAQDLVLGAAQRLDRDTGLRDRRHSAMYVKLLAVASYTAALRDQRDSAWTLLTEAENATNRTGSSPETALELAVYRVSVARVLGDFGSAVDHASRVDPARIRLPERRARYWEDTALALHGRGRPAAAFRALQVAERETPQEVRFRPWAQHLVGDLMSGDRRNALPGLRDFAARVGV